MRRAVVTGGAGFIGSHVVDALLARGASVLVIDDLSSGNARNLDSGRKSANDRLTLLELSVCDDGAAKAVEEYRPEAVFHLAAQINVRRSVTEPALDAESNVVGTVQMLEAARVAESNAFVFSSTGGAIYGEQDYFPADELHGIHPEAPYGVSKRAAELYLEHYAKSYNMRCAAMRFANIYGPRQNAKGEAGVVSIFAERLIGGQPLVVNGDGEQTRDFVFVNDAVDACLRAYDASTLKGFFTYNVGTGIETTVNQLTEILVDCWKSERGTTEEVIVEYGPGLEGEQRRSVIDPAKLKKELGWSTSLDVKQGLAATLKSFIEAAGL